MMWVCRECYWSEWETCEVHGKIRYGGCWDFLDDKTHSKFVREKLKTNPPWCEENWNLLDSVDREKFFKYYGKPNLKPYQLKTSK